MNELEPPRKPCRFGVLEKDGEIYIVDSTCHSKEKDYRILKMIQDSDFKVNGVKDLAEGICQVLNLALDREKVNKFH